MAGPPPRPHPLHRSTLAGRLNRLLETAWQRGWSERPSLDPDTLWRKALRSAPAEGETEGRSKDDAADFRLRLEILSASLLDQARLNALGLTIAHGLLVRAIRQRLHLGALWLGQPELPRQPIAPPIIVVGQMRSGTTRVHRLLAADPRHAATRFCDSWNPAPRRPDTRPLWSGLSLLLARQINPWLDAIHPFGVTRPDEELGWLACALDHCAYEAQWRIPAFTAFSEARDPQAVYREFARILRTDAAWHANAGKPRVLKVPQFAEDLPALLAQFPDARVVRTRRNPAEVARSSASLVANQMAIQSDHAEMGWIETETERKIAMRESRMDAALARFNGPLAEVDFDEMGRNWQQVATRLYADLGIALSPEATSAMAIEQARAHASTHRQHAASYRRFARAQT